MEQAQEVKTEVLERLFSTNARRCLEAVSDEDIEKAGLRDKAVAAGIYTDKRRLLSGEPPDRRRICEAPFDVAYAELAHLPERESDP